MKKLLLIFFVLGASALSAAELSLSVKVDNPLVSEDDRQSVYLRVGLTGFEGLKADDRAPLNVALVLDRSGSMEGEKLERTKEAARYAVRLLGSKDILSIITFESEVQVLLPATRVSDKSRILKLIDGIETDGSTALFAGVSTGAAEVRKFLRKELVNRIILLSDGMANVGPDSPGELAELGASLGKEGIPVTTMGLGLDYNEDLMVRLAQASDGNHAFIREPEDLVKVFNAEFKDALSVVAQKIKLVITCSAGVKPLRIVNREGEISGQRVEINLNQVYSRQEKYVLIEVELPPLNAGKIQRVADVNVSYLNLQTGKAMTLADGVQVKATAQKEEVERNRNVAVIKDLAVQRAALASEKAVELRDKGKVDDAKKVLDESSKELQGLGREMNAPDLIDLGKQSAADSASLGQTDQWNEQRKAMRGSEYEKKNQQSY